MIHKIKAEIERLKAWQPIASPSLDKLCSFLDSLQEEPVNEELEAEIKRYVYDPYFNLNGVAVKGATEYLTVEDVKDIAKHFFELGLSVSNKAEKRVEEEPYVMGKTGRYSTTTK